MTATEYATDPASEAIRCPCRNTADSDGFVMCRADGTLVGPYLNSTPSAHVLCLSCVRIIESASGLVTGTASLAADGRPHCLHEDVEPERGTRLAWCQSCARNLDDRRTPS